MIPYSRQHITKEDAEAIQEAIFDPFLTQGPKVEEFETKLANLHGCKGAVVCSSGSAALHLAYASCGVDENGIGIVPAITFASTANGFRHLGAKVMFCDVNPKTGLIDLESLEESLKKANVSRRSGNGVIAPVSFAGQVAPLKECHQLGEKYGFKVVEDASHSPLAWDNNTCGKVRSCECEWTDYATLSFHPVKHLCCGEGGAVLCKSEEHSVQPRNLRSHGIERNTDPGAKQPWKYEQKELGWNYRLTDLQASLGVSQLNRLENEIEARRRLANVYSNEFQKKPYSEIFAPPPFNEGHVWHLYIIRFKEPKWRDDAFHFLKSNGIVSQVHYIPVYHHPYYGGVEGNEELPGAEKFYSSCLSIPLFPMMSDYEQKKVIDTLHAYSESLIS